ncbi:arsenate reductase (glutaredoxin) [Yoonia sp. I 8.24]|uniref:arsenate reductase (glutaredoxin) n=1 Tax=Yoonia sp. I 8.24 TaxID=1537229 RepID=UPI001EDE7304|nr:arsenate reductase (glutaredoxin) [Yoonia sp. I 8.24]MCG3267426.1 arsenate reductase (glutaredoxin) [Yoonia sp. I 8.24]
MTTVIYHNANCSASRNALAVIRASGTEPIVVKYLETGWTRAQLLGLFAAAGFTPSEAMRAKRSPAADLGLLDTGVTDDQILDAMVAHPVLVERPFVCSPKGTALCRPLSNLLPLLEIPLRTAVTDSAGKVILQP